MLCGAIQPTLVVTGCIWKSAKLFPANLNMAFSQNIYNCSLNTFNPVIVLVTDIEPAPLAALNSPTAYGAENIIFCVAADIPA